MAVGSACLPVILALDRCKQEDQEFRANFSYMRLSRKKQKTKQPQNTRTQKNKKNKYDCI